MYISEKDFLTQKVIVEFTLPKLHKGKKWYVDFFAYDPSIDGMRRKRYMLDRYRTHKLREEMAFILIHNLYEKLKAGWNPWTKAKKTRQYTSFEIVLTRYEEYIDTAEKKKILKEKTATDYRSRLNQLRNFLSESGTRLTYVYQFDRIFAVDFLDYLILDKDVSAKTRNNYRTWLSTFATWLKERQYLDTNPVEEVHMMKEAEKFRDQLSADDLRKVREWTSKYNGSPAKVCGYA